MPLQPNTRLGRYEIRARIGEGGMGEVYRARDEKLNRDVAIKVLPASFSADEERLHRFEQEAQAVGMLNHPNILAVYDIGVHDGTTYVVSELLEGETFREVLDAGPMPQRKAIDYAVQISRGLAAAHEKGITHRDLKPDNLFLTKDGHVKILDFGLAKLNLSSNSDGAQTDIATRKVHTDPGTVMGTAGYMAPEQVRAGVIDHRSDIFSLGAVLYEMLSGRRAFHGDSAIETLNAILKQEPTELSNSNPSIPPALERVVWHCLEKSPERRFQSAGDIAFALESLSSVSSHPSQQTLITGRATTRSSINRERLIWAGVCGLLLLMAAALVVTRYWQKPVAQRTARLSVAIPPGVTHARDITISPDGSRVVFGAMNDAGKYMLWVRSIDSTKTEELPGTEGAFFPFWSPDSHSIGYFTGPKLFRVDAAGGRPQVLCDVGESSGGSWNREGVILFGGVEGISRVSAQGGTPTLVTAVNPEEEAHRWPYFLPDGHHFVFLGDANTTEGHHIRVGSLDSRDSQVLFSAVSRVEYSAPGYLLYVNQGALVAKPFDASTLRVGGEPTIVAERISKVGENHSFDFSVSNEGTLAYVTGGINAQLTWVDRNGKKLSTVGETGPYDEVSLSPDNKATALGLLDADGRKSDVWLIDLLRNTSSRFTFDPAGESSPVWSPDGRMIVFSRTEGTGGNEINLYQRSASGTGDPERLLQSDATKIANSWSPDGKILLFENWAPQAKSEIWSLSLADRQAKPLLKSASSDRFEGQFSPDGQFVAYVSNESGRVEIYLQRFPISNERWQVSTTGGAFPLWRSDGKELFFISHDKLMSAEIKVGPKVETSIPRELFSLGFLVPELGYPYAVSKDGQRFLLNIPADLNDAAPMTIVLNWTDSLTSRK